MPQVMTNARPSEDCIYPQRSADVVSVLATAVRALAGNPSKKAPVSDAINTLREGVRDLEAGNHLVMVTATELSAPIFGDSPFRVRLGVIPYGGPGYSFHSVSEAMSKGRPIAELKPKIEDRSIIEANEMMYVACIILTASESERGQLSHPTRFARELDKIEDVWRAANMDDSRAVEFLDVLQAACLRAHRAMVLFAGVAIEDVVPNGRADVRLEPVFGSSPDECEVEANRRIGSCTCRTMQVVQHEAAGDGP